MKKMIYVALILLLSTPAFSFENYTTPQVGDKAFYDVKELVHKEGVAKVEEYIIVHEIVKKVSGRFLVRTLKDGVEESSDWYLEHHLMSEQSFNRQMRECDRDWIRPGQGGIRWQTVGNGSGFGEDLGCHIYSKAGNLQQILQFWVNKVPVFGYVKAEVDELDENGKLVQSSLWVLREVKYGD